MQNKKTKRIIKEQPDKSSDSKRVNFDNESKKKFFKQYQRKNNFNKKKKATPVDPTSQTNKPNDVTWYSKNPTLLKAAGSFPFSSVVGAQMQSNNRVPGIFSVTWYPNIRMGDDASALKQAFDSEFSFLVHANSRNYNYDPVDLAVLTLSGIELFGALAACIRAYGICKYYTEESRYTGDAILRTIGFDPDDLRKNLGQAWFDINLRIERSRQVWIPNTMPLLARRIWLNSNVYKDAEGKRAQLYLFNQGRFFQFRRAIGNKAGSSLSAIPDPRVSGGGAIFSPGANWLSANSSSPTVGLHSWATWMTILDSMLDALINDQDRGIIYGDILKAYGTDKIYAMPTIPADYRIEPVYNPEVLTQFENTVPTPAYQPIGFVQNEAKWLDYIASSSMADADIISKKANIPNMPVLNFHQPEQPTPEQIIIATRMMSAGPYVKTVSVPTQLSQFMSKTADGWTPTFNVGKTIHPRSAGSEIATAFALTWVSNSTGSAYYVEPLSDYHASYVKAAAFDWSPIAYNMNEGGTYANPNQYLGTVSNFSINPSSSSPVGVPTILGEMDNYAEINYVDLDKLHLTAIFSLLGVPQI